MVISSPPATAPAVAPLPASVISHARPAPHGWTSYTVRNGDTLIGVAARFRTTVGVIAAKNGIRARAHIVAGATLSVPRTSAAKPSQRTAPASLVHVVRSGETLGSIAVRYRVPLASLLKTNHLRATAFTQPGQRIVVRGAAASARAARGVAKGAAYRVRPGDTLGGIAIRHRTSVAAIARASGISTRAVLQAGQRLTLPGRSSSATRTAVPDTFNGVRYPRAVAEAAARNRAALARRSVPNRSATRHVIVRTASRHGIDARLALAIGYQESGWNQRLVSPANAVGTMQVIPEGGRWASDLAGRRLNLLDTHDNVTAGVVMLRSLGRSTKSMEDTVAAYYQGLGSLRQHGMYADTKAYVRSVMALRKIM